MRFGHLTVGKGLSRGIEQLWHMYDNEGTTLTLAAAGDAIITRRLSTCENERLARLVERIREADVGVVNLEVLLHDYEGYPAAKGGGTYMRAPPWAADELVWAGFDLFAAATNHIGDYSHGGMEATMRELDQRDLAYAGLGRTLATAREPAYLDTPAGRVALVAACSSITPGTEAGEQRPDLKGRPGLSPIHVEPRYVVPEDVFDQVCELADQLGLEAITARQERLGFPAPGEDDEEGEFTFLNVDRNAPNLTFERGDEFGIRLDASEDDVDAVRKQIRAADRQADWVVASVHAHQGADGFRNDPSVPAFLESFARECVDAGADAFVGHGPHVLRGIEMYDGTPIFYSLGNFLMQNETVTRLPAELYDDYELGHDALPADLFDARVFEATNEEENSEGTRETDERIGFLADRSFWESVVPICRFDDGTLDRIELYPLELGYATPRPQRGRPLLAEDDAATRILEDLAELSAPYGTEIVIEGGRGVIVADENGRDDV